MRLFSKSTSRNKFNKKLSEVSWLGYPTYQKEVESMKMVEKLKVFVAKMVEAYNLRQINRDLQRERELVELYTFNLK